MKKKKKKKKHKEGIYKVLERSVVLSVFYVDICLCPKSVIITTLIKMRKYHGLEDTCTMQNVDLR